MAITTELVGKLGGGLTWTKVAGAPKTIAWNASEEECTLTTVQLDKTKKYLLACKYNYTSGTPASTYLSFFEDPAPGGMYPWNLPGVSGFPVKMGSNSYPVVISAPATTTGKVGVMLSPSYNSGTHVLSADLYYAELPSF